MQYILHSIKNQFIFFQPPVLFFITLSFALGIILKGANYFLLGSLLLVPLTLLFYFFSCRRLYLLLFALFYAAGAIRFYSVIEKQKQFFSDLHNKKINMQAYVTDTITTNAYPFCTRLQVKATKITRHDGKLYAINDFFYIYTNSKSCNIGDTILLHNVSCKKPTKDSFLLYLIKENVNSAIFCFKSSIKKQGHSAWSVSTVLPMIRNNLFKKLSKKIDRKTFVLFSTIFLGNRAAVKNEIMCEQKLFAKWGIVHYLARSGLHVLILILLWSWILSFFSLAHTTRWFLLTALVLLYGLLSWSSVSFIRALFMFLCYQSCIAAKLPIQSLHLLSLVALVLLAYNPVHVFYLDFQLSFGLTFIIAWLAILRTKRRILGIS